MANFEELISYDNLVFRTYVFWSSILIIKVLAMAYLTSRQRMNKKVVPNPEDVGFLKDPKVKDAKFDDPDVERVRRAHRNDLENCLPLIVVGFFYVLTNPEVSLAINLFRAAVICRIVHTIVYAIVPTQPARAISWFVCYAITIYMAYKTAVFFM